MKKIRMILILTILSMALTSCKSSVKLEVPEFIARLEFGEDIDEEYLENLDGVNKLDIKKDGRLIFFLDRDYYNSELKYRKDSLENSLKSLKYNSQFNFIKDIDYKKDYSKINILVDRDKLLKRPESTIYISNLIGLDAYKYQIYAKIDRGLEIEFLDINNEIVDSINFPEDFKTVLDMEDK